MWESYQLYSQLVVMVMSLKSMPCTCGLPKKKKKKKKELRRFTIRFINKSLRKHR